MKKYLLLFVGLLLGANQLGWYMYIRWNVDSESLAIASATLTTLIMLSGFIGRKTFYEVILALCTLSLLINIISICASYPGDEIGWYHQCWFFVRPLCLLMAIYLLYKSSQTTSKVHSRSRQAIIS